MSRTGLPFNRIAAPAPRLALTALGLLAAVLAGCSTSHSSTSGPAKPVPGTCLSGGAAPLTIVVGERSNVPSIQFPPPTAALIQTAAIDKQPIRLIRIDGKPSVIPVEKFTTTAKNGGAYTDALNSYVRGVEEGVDGPMMHAVAPQADLLSALSYAAGATPVGGNIIVIDSGLQTAGQLEYQAPGMLMSPPSDVVSFLKSKGLIPPLTGRHVLLSGFGYAAAPQAILDQPERQNVAAQWAAIVQAGGACVTVDPTPNTNQEMPGLPTVAAVPLPAPPVFKSCGTTVLSDAGSVGFNVGVASFRDPAEARQTLSKLATVLNQGTEPIILIGSTSSEGGDSVNNPLSLNRAKAVEAVLVSLGVPADRISVVGDGAHYPKRVADTGPGGQLLLPQAEQDREVIVQLPQCQGAAA